jgi:tetratricopeptide (TPR) repeat protein
MAISIVERGRAAILWSTWAHRCGEVLAGLAFCTALSLAAGERRDPGYTQSVLAIQQQIQTGDLDGARTATLQAQKKFPADGGLENLLGVIEAQQGHAEAARQHFLAAVSHDPQLAGAYLNLSRIDMQSAANNPALRAEAFRMSERVLEMDSSNEEARFQVATIDAWEKNYTRAMAQLEHLSPQAQRSVAVQVLACQVRASLPDRTALRKAVAALGNNPDLTEQDAFACIPQLRSAHRADLIVELLTASSGRRPLSARELQVLGLAYEAQNQLTEARATLERAFAADPASVGTLIDLTRVARAAGDNQGALGYLAHARDLRPSDGALAYEFAVICVQMGLHMEAKKAISEALALDPDNPQYNLAMGSVITYSTAPAEALPYLKKYQSLQPNDANGLLALGIASFKLDDYNAAVSWLKQAAGHPSTAAEAHYYLGRAEQSQGHLEEAWKEFEEALRVSPNQPNILAELGRVALLQHNNEEAARYLNQALQVDPDNYLANYGLMQLYARTKDPRKEKQEERFNQVKDKQDQQELQSRRLFEIRRDGESGDAAEPAVKSRSPENGPAKTGTEK